MSYLVAIINVSKQTVTFSGTGTFSNKDKIKALGKAKFIGHLKTWEVCPWSGSVEELYELFPGIEIQTSEETVSCNPAIQSDNSEPTTSLDMPNTDLARLSVSTLLSQVQHAIMHTLPPTFCIFGCLAQVKRHESRVFLELADDKNRDIYVNCVIWADEHVLCSKLEESGFHLEPDLQVMFIASAQVNKRGAKISLKIEGVVPDYTLQKFAALREITNKRLRKEGLFDKNRECSLPFLPRKLLLLTSKAGTVINDFCASLNQADFGFELIWLPVNVQGKTAKKQLLEGIERVLQIQEVDAILIFRGGGSPSELAIFNDYEVAKAVCLCPLPVFSAIGHQEDMSSTQDVSYRAFGVPKDLGRFFADIVKDRRSRLNRSTEILLNKASVITETQADRFTNFHVSAVAHIQQIMRSKDEHLHAWERSIPNNSRALLAQRLEIFKRGVHGLHLLTSWSFDATNAILLRVSENISNIWNVKFQTAHTKLKHEIRLLRSLINKTLERGYQRFITGSHIKKDCEIFIRQEDLRLAKYEDLLREISPEVQLRRGFAIVSHGSTIVTSAANLSKDANVELEFWDAKKRAKILE